MELFIAFLTIIAWVGVPVSVIWFVVNTTRTGMTANKVGATGAHAQAISAHYSTKKAGVLFLLSVAFLIAKYFVV